MKKFTFLFAFIIINVNLSFSQWVPLPNAPVTGSRLDDVYFIDDNTGWTCSGGGGIYHTTNGGSTWIQQLSAPEYFRSIEFINSTTGFCGSLNGTVYKTINGGNTWVDITSALPVPTYGICGISHWDSTVFLVGSWSAGAQVFKSFDGGNTWSYTNLSNLTDYLVDCLFTGPNEIFVSGNITSPVANGGVILHSTDNGSTWVREFVSNQVNDYVWKMQSIGNGLMVASIESMVGNATWFAKSTNGGNTWLKLPVSLTINNDAEGIGFVNDSVGFIDGWGLNMFKTTNGGATWSVVQPNNLTNRFFILPSGIAYASGTSVWKYSPLTTEIPEISQERQTIHKLIVSPNPAQTEFSIYLDLAFDTYIILEMYNIKSQEILPVFKGRVSKGIHNHKLKSENFSAGAYQILFRSNEHFLTEKFIIVH